MVVVVGIVDFASTAALTPQPECLSFVANPFLATPKRLFWFVLDQIAISKGHRKSERLPIAIADGKKNTCNGSKTMKKIECNTIFFIKFPPIVPRMDFRIGSRERSEIMFV